MNKNNTAREDVLPINQKVLSDSIHLSHLRYGGSRETYLLEEYVSALPQHEDPHDLVGLIDNSIVGGGWTSSITSRVLILKGWPNNITGHRRVGRWLGLLRRRNVISGMSISVENFPPVSAQKFPHGLVGYSVFNPDFRCLNR
jgi:hypothetical protein